MLICGIIIFMEIPITQSEAWHILQKDLGEKSIFIKEKNYQFVAIIKPIPMGNYLYCPYGPIAKEKETFKLAIDALKKIATEEKAIFIRVEPFKATEAKYLPKNTVKSQDLNPKETWLLDLQGSEEDLSSKLPSRLLRYYRGAEQKGITIETSHDPADIHFLLELQRALARQKKISTFSEHYLQTELKQPFATLYLAKKDQQVIAAGLVFDDEYTIYKERNPTQVVNSMLPVFLRSSLSKMPRKKASRLSISGVLPQMTLALITPGQDLLISKRLLLEKNLTTLVPTTLY